MLHTANNNKDVFRGHGHTKTRVKTTIVDVALPWKSSALITLNERDHCVLQRFTFEEFHDFYFKRGIQEQILQVWILKCSHICFTKCVYCTEDGRSTSVFSLYWQLSQGWMADFPDSRLMIYRVVIKSSHGLSVFHLLCLNHWKEPVYSWNSLGKWVLEYVAFNS